MSKKWVPNGHSDFLIKAESLARTVAKDPARYQIEQADADELSAKAAQFRAAFQASRHGQSSPVTNLAMRDARTEAERIVRRLGNLVRSNPRLSPLVKMELGIRPRETNVKPLPCPMEAPRLRFVRALHESGATPIHELEFRQPLKGPHSKPPGAVRLELFVGLIPPDEPIPTHPGPGTSAFTWYLRSYTRSPIKIIPPMARVPMRVVYWGRWADSLGEVGPFSATAVGWMEGGVQGHLPGAVPLVFPGIGRPKPVKELDVAQPTRPGRDRTYLIAVLEAQEQSMYPQGIAPQLPDESEEAGQRQLEGPPPADATNEAA